MAALRADREDLHFVVQVEVQASKGEGNFQLATVQPLTDNIAEVKVDKGELLIRLKPPAETKSEIEIKPLAVGMPAPELLSCGDWVNDNGKNFPLAALRGRVVLLDSCDFFR